MWVRKRRRNQYLAVLMVFAMIMSLIMVPGKVVQAEERTQVTVTDAANTNNEVYVVLEKVNDIPAYSNDAGNWPEQALCEYKLRIVNNKATSISDWKVTITLANAPYWGYGYNNVTHADNSNVITIDTYSGTNDQSSTWDNMTVTSGEGDGAGKDTGAGFAIPSSALNGAAYTLTYYDGESSGTAGGSGSGGSGSGGSSDFDGSNIGTIDTSTNYNFAKLLQLSLYFYDANMCGDQVNETSLYSKDLGGWRGDCHVNDYFTYNGKQYQAVGGYHDAGDHVKFGMPANESFITLGISYLEFGQAFDELNQTQHFKTIVDYYCTYLKSCTVLNASGTAAEAFCYQIGCGQKDHASWTAPEVENESQTNRTYSLVATSSNPATEYVAGAAAALAINYLNFGNEEDLKYAKALFAMAKNNSKQTGSTDTSGSFYNSGSWQDEYCLAAAMLYKITKDSTYAAEYNSNNNNNGNLQKPNGWCNLYQFASYYAPTKNTSEWNTINNWLSSQANGSMSSYYWGDDSWGTARINCNVQFSALLYDKFNNADTYAPWCKYQMSTILGNNSRKINLVCGYNGASPKKPHHRAASGYTGWDGANSFNNNSDQKYTLYGALVGGPTSSDFNTYNDSVNDSTSNEVTLDYNAGMVGAAAALYLLNKNSTEQGFTEQTVLSDFFGGSNAPAKPPAYTGGSTGGEDPDDTISSITLSKTSSTLDGTGKTATATITVKPATADKTKITVVSDNTNVATASISGSTLKVTAGELSGTAKITVSSTEDASIQAVYTVAVKHSITAFTVNTESVSIKVLDKAVLSVAGTTPINADAYTVNWSVADSTIATLNQTTGTSVELTALKAGSTTVTAKIGSLTKTINVKVSLAEQPAPRVTYTPVYQSSNEIQVKAATGLAGTLELSLDKATWVQAQNGIYTFKQLQDGKDYTVYARLAQTSSYSASAVSEDTYSTYTVYAPSKITNADGFYKIDLSKITGADCDYVKKLADKVENGIPSTHIDVSSSGNSIMVTIKDGVPCSFTGTNEKAVITASGSNEMMLSDVTVDKIVINGSVTLTYTGENTISNGMNIEAAGTLLIDNDIKNQGKLNIAGTIGAAISGNGIVDIAEGDITINANGDAVVVNDFRMSGGTVTVNSSSGSGITAEYVNINGGGLIVESEGSAISGGSISLSDADVSLTVRGLTDVAIVSDGGFVLGNGTITIDAVGDGIHIIDPDLSDTLVPVFEINGGRIEISSSNGNGVVAEWVALQGGTVIVESEGTAISGDSITVSGAEVSLEVTGTEASVMEAENGITLASGSIITARPEGSNGYDYNITSSGEGTGSIVVGDDMIISGEPEYSTPPVDDEGTVIAFVNITVHNSGSNIAFQCKANTSCNLLEEPTIKELIQAQPYKTASFLVNNQEVKDGKLEVGTDDIEVTMNWTAKVYTIKYVTNSGKFSNHNYKTSYTVNDGTYTLPTNIARSNYVFLGWYKESTFKQKVTSVSVENDQNVTIYAKWAIDKPAKPKISSAANSNTGVTIKWGAVSGAKYYIIQRRVSGGNWTKLAQTTNGTTTSYTDKKVTNGKVYYYRVCGFGYHSGSYSDSSKSVRYITAPKISSAVNDTTGVTLKWSAVSGATGYQIYRSTNGGSYAKIATVKGSSKVTYRDTKATGRGTKYQYRVYTYRTISGVTYKSGTSNIKTIYHLATPTAPSIYIASTGMKLTWSATTGATGYYIYRSANDGSYTKVATVTGRTYTDTKVSNGSKYKYKVMAYKTVSGTTYKSVISASRSSYFISKPGISSLTNSGSRTMTAKWSKNTRATGYQIQYSTSSTFSNATSFSITKNSTVSKTMTGLTKGKTYYVRIRSYKTVGSTKYYSSWSLAAKVKISK